jgi:putative DNA primase/helicase
MSSLFLGEIARVLGRGRQVLAAWPGQDRSDRSLSATVSVSSPDGFLVHSFAADDFRVCRDYVKQRLGIGVSCRDNPVVVASGSDETLRRLHHVRNDKLRIERAQATWREGVGIRGTLVEQYMAFRGLNVGGVLPDVIWCHPCTPWTDVKTGTLALVPCMIAAMRSIGRDQIPAPSIGQVTASTNGTANVHCTAMMNCWTRSGDEADFGKGRLKRPP